MTTITDRVRHAVATEEVKQAEALMRGDGPSMARGFVADENTFSNLGRYEAGIERILYRTLHELERLQADRGDAPPEPPAVVDVTVASVSP